MSVLSVKATRRFWGKIYKGLKGQIGQCVRTITNRTFVIKRASYITTKY